LSICWTACGPGQNPIADNQPAGDEGQIPIELLLSHILSNRTKIDIITSPAVFYQAADFLHNHCFLDLPSSEATHCPMPAEPVESGLGGHQIR
jgi:hypothetical protein